MNYIPYANISYGSLMQFVVQNLPDEIQSRVLFVTLGGSHAYGTSTPQSDIDIRGVYIAPKSHYVGFLQYAKTINRSFDIDGKKVDVEMQELRQFLQLAVEANPNILEYLWIPESKYLFTSPMWERVRKQRELFLSTKVKYTFSGYAMSQLKRMKNHHVWHSRIPPQQPTRRDYHLPENTKFTVAEESVIRKFLNVDEEYSEEDTRRILPDECHQRIVDFLDREKSYREAFQLWKSYQTWKQERNPIRADLEKKYGYDSKHALHTIRLYRMGIELLETGMMHVERPDAPELLNILHGEYSYEEVMEMVSGFESAIEIAAACSALPHDARRNEVNELCQKLVQQFIFGNYNR